MRSLAVKRGLAGKTASFALAVGLALARLTNADDAADGDTTSRDSGAPAANAEAPKAPSEAVADASTAPAELSGDSTLKEWKTAPREQRSRVAVAIARNHLPETASKLDVAKAAMEITGCLSATANDARFDSWKVAPTANTCLTAPEKPAP